jgi:hypothetical protein
MHGRENHGHAGLDLQPFVRNRYFYGQLLDVQHFDLEQAYFKQKISLGHRLVSGYGVVCGLDVRLCDDGRSVRVEPGIALDKVGREIIVPSRSAHVALPPAAPEYDHAHEQEGCECEHGSYVQVCVCFHECATDPAPVLTSECDTERCAPSAIRERYKIELRKGRAKDPEPVCSLNDVVAGGHLSYDALATWITRACRPLPDDPCIPIANVRLATEEGKCEAADVDITIRPIVYTNDLLYELILCVILNGQDRPHGGKY